MARPDRKLSDEIGRMVRRPINSARRLIAAVSGSDLYIDYDNVVRAARDIRDGEAIALTREQYNLLLEDLRRQEK